MLIAALPKPEKLPDQRFDVPYRTVMDREPDARDYTAGHSDRAERLDETAWAGMVGKIRAIAELARDAFGIRAVIHPHAGGHIEFANELQRVAEDIPGDVAGPCLDTSHCAYSGMEPVEARRRYRDRLDCIRFKDVDPSAFDSIMGERIRSFDACAA